MRKGEAAQSRKRNNWLQKKKQRKQKRLAFLADLKRSYKRYLKYNFQRLARERSLKLVAQSNHTITKNTIERLFLPVYPYGIHRLTRFSR